MRKKGVLFAAIVPLGLAGWYLLRPHAPPPPQQPPAPRPVVKMDPTDDGHDDERSYVFRIPSGEPTTLTCEEARAIVDQVRAGLAYAPEQVKAVPFATSTADWLDPHGVLSLAKDAPTARAINRSAPELLADIEGKRRRGCAGALAPAAVLE